MYDSQGSLIRSFHILVLYFCSLRSPNDKSKHAYSKIQSLRKHLFCACFLCVFLMFFSEILRAEHAFIHIAPFVFRKYILNNFECLEVSILFAILNIHKFRIFPGWLLQTFLLETSSFIFKCTVHSEVWFSVSNSGSAFPHFKISLSLIRA
jgi:hypothetical protein